MNDIREGDLYKIINIRDNTFEIRYGYYEEADRHSKYSEPIPIFPDFIKEPIYTKEGYPFITHMQDKCKYYKGDLKEESCYKCIHYKKQEDLIGICTCALNRRVREKISAERGKYEK